MVNARGIGQPPPERIDPLEEPPGIVAHHLAKYAVASAMLGPGTIADIGCGLGYGTASLDREDRSIFGVDVDEETIRTATSRYSTRRLAFALMDGQVLAFRKESLDGVVCFEALEHLRDPHRHIAEVARVLKSAGTYIVSTPRAGTGGSPDINPHHHHEFDREGLERLLLTFFDDVSLMGQTRRRTGLHALAVRLDVLGLRRGRLMQPTLRRIATFLGGRATEDALPEDFSIGPDLGESSELVAVCRAPRKQT